MKNRHRLIIGILMIVSIIGLVFILKKPQIQLKSTEFFVEYGNKLSTDLEDYLDLEGLDDSHKNKILNRSRLEITITNEDKKDYPKLGEYNGTVIVDEEKLHFKVIIKDTQPPQFENFEAIIETAISVKPNYEEFFKVNDLSTVTIQCDDQNVRYDVPGKYKAMIKAIDESGNHTSQEITVKVLKLSKEDYVIIKKYIPNIYIDLKYASSDNFTKEVIYDFKDAYLRYGTVEKLKNVQTELWNLGYSLKIWDAYRPIDAQQKLWDVVSNPRYVANPKKPIGHNLGGTVDITLVKKDGQEIPMPTEFDDFSLKADRNYGDIQDLEAVKNVKLLEEVMQKNGFKGYKNEWWDYSDSYIYSFVDFQPHK